MVTNSISPFEGSLVWVGTPNSGTSQFTGQPWKMVDFVLKYTDYKMQEQYIALTASGVERVDKLITLPLGTMLRVEFQISARKSEYNGQEKWWGALNVFRITPMAQEQPAQQATPRQPVQQGLNPPQQPVYQQPAQQPIPTLAPEAQPSDDLPF